MVMGSWLIQKIRDQEEKKLAERVDRVFGAGTYKRLEEQKRRQGSVGGVDAGGDAEK